MKRGLLAKLLTVPILIPSFLLAQEGGSAKAIVAKAVQTELNADHTDHAAFQYRDHDVTADHDTVFEVIETPQGSLKRKLSDHGVALSSEQRHVDDLRIHAFVHDPSLQQKQKKDSVHDDQQAESMLKLLPVAFLWTIRSATGSEVTLDFKPDPEFHAPSMEAKVLSAMSGEIVVARPSNRIRHLRGKLTDDVKLGYGLLGRLKAGGTFNVERREVAPGHWQITESHVHMDGRALLFKTIGEQEDETKTDFKLSPSETLEEASNVLGSGAGK
jgi:hypothetical protein